ncbi:hypothetical protein Btru_048113 [Bulinus truncatus]|nr:hypothetical protein Btru_048113 [Bulinus truncatus]
MTMANGFLIEDSTKCPENFVYKTYKKTKLCIYVSEDHSDYFQARENCKRRGALLFSPRTPEKFEIINKVLPDDYD